jgi:hypothetical protein
MADKKATTLAVIEKVREIATIGRLDRKALRSAFGPNISDFQYTMAEREAREALQHEGFFIKTSPKHPGFWLVSTAEDVTRKALETSRRKVVRVARGRMTIIQDAQKHPGMDDEAKNRLQTEELLYGRTLQFMERALLKSQRKRPEGLE